MDNLSPGSGPDPLVTSLDMRHERKVLVANSRNKMVECGRESSVVVDVMHLEGPVTGCRRALPSCLEDFMLEFNVGQ